MNLLRLQPALIWLLLIWQTPVQPAASFSHFRYMRGLTMTPGVPAAPSTTQACSILDADVFAHAAPGLKDLHLYSGAAELAYDITVIEPAQPDSDEARILNARSRAGQIVFDLEMPRRAYTGVTLDLVPHDYIAKAIVSGSSALKDGTSTPLGNFTLFDLSSQHLFHNTSIPLSESNFPFLHVELALVPAPGSAASSAALNLPANLRSAAVPPSREAQSLYTATQSASSMLQEGDESVATFNVPARAPVERITFALPPGYNGSFSRNVRIEARGVSGEGPGGRDDPNSSDGFRSEDAAGTILQVHKSEAGHDLSVEDLSVPVAIGSNMQQAATIEVRVQNGADGSLPLSVELQMRQRRICFDPARVNGPLMLYYGDPSLDVPAYGNVKPAPDAAAPRLWRLGPEVMNPSFAATPSPRRFMGQRPVLRWIALLGCVCIFALLVIRRTHHRRR